MKTHSDHSLKILNNLFTVILNAIGKQHEYSIYGYYKGEKKNPYEKLLDEAEIDKSHLPPPECMKYEYNISNDEVERLTKCKNFWGYERMFANDFDINGFSFDYWKENLSFANSVEEIKGAFNPPDLDELFKLWLYQLLYHISDKYEIDFGTVSEWYWNNKIK